MPAPRPLLDEKPSVSAVIPMFNEEENIGHALAFLAPALERHTSDYEIIIVNDASTDRSPEIVARAAAANPRIRLISHEKNRKLGGTLRTGFAAAAKDVVFYTDADLAVDPEDIGRAIRALRLTRADLIAAYRFSRVPEGLRRTIYSRAYNTFIGLLFGWPLRDVNFAFKLFRREVIDAFDLRAEGSLIDAELVIKAKNSGFVVQQIGVDYFPRAYGQSHLASPGIIVRILRELVTLYPDMRRPRPKRRNTPAPDAADRPEAEAR
jgi:glycosyltransferase involved in cell wall biosynthesis